MSRKPALFIVLEDTPDVSPTSDASDNMDPLSIEEDGYSSLSSQDQSDFLYGYFDDMFVEHLPFMQITIPPSPKKTRIIQCSHTDKKADEAGE